MVRNSLSPFFQPRGCVRPVCKVKGNCERVQEPASNRLCPHVSSPWDARSTGDPIWGMLLLAIFPCAIFLPRGKIARGNLEAGMGHILGSKSHVCIVPLLRLLPAMAMEIWDRACGLFRPNIAVYAIPGQVANSISSLRKEPS